MSYLPRCTKEQSIALKELGFNIPVNARYRKSEEGYILVSGNYCTNPRKNNFSAPLIAEALKWFREKYGVRVIVDCDEHGYFYEIKDNHNKRLKLWAHFGDYEYTESHALSWMINYVKENKT